MDKETEPFFTAPTAKLVIMALCTFGFYEFYWFCKNWQVIKRSTGEFVMPGWRATFSPIYAYGCFNHIKKSAQEINIEPLAPAYPLAIVYLSLSILSWSLWFVSDSSLVSFLSTFSFLPIIPINSMAVKVNEKRSPGYRKNGFTLLNGIVVAGGCCLMLLNTSFTTSAIDCAALKLYPQIAALETALNPDQSPGSDVTGCTKK